MVPIFVLISLFSCSKDTDLLADFVISDLQEARFIGNLAISDNFVVAPQKSIVLDVLANDTFTDPDKVKIVETSQPTNGTVVINKDKTLTFYPDSADAPDTGTDNETQDSQSEPENDSAEEEASTPTQTEATKETSQEEEAIDTPKEEETKETPQQEEETEQKEDQKEAVTETFDYSVESTDEEGNKTSQQATVTVTTNLGDLKAFPGAEGFGENTVGGRGGIVYHVQNLNRSGPGSLRYGLQKIKVPRTIVFDVSGYIDISGDCSIRDPYVTIAGQTAPEGGVTLKGGSLIVRTSEVIVRHLAIRPGVAAGDASDCIRIVAETDNLNIKNVIFDHLSLSWSRDENIGMSASETSSSISNVTIQNCLIAEPLEYYGSLVGKKIKNLSFLKNLWANVPNRIPETTYGNTGESFEFINNIIYNYGRATTIVYGTAVDIIGNAYKVGPTAPERPNLIYHSGPYSPSASEGNIYASDNIQIGRANAWGFKNSNWKKWESSQKVQKNSWYNSIPASSLESTLLKNVGSILFNDAVDARILREYESVTGIRGPKSETQVGGYPLIGSISRPSDYDSDYDGMPDKWEIANNLDPIDPNDRNADVNDDGYTNLESFLYSLTRS